VLTVVWLAATLIFLVIVARSIERKITWYLAVDQYGYLAFAHDLMHGKVFHHWPPLDALVPRLPARVDVLSQTYVYDNGLLYCRYAPGFAMLLAGWLGLFGDDGAHYLNLTVYVALLVVALTFQARVFRSRWRALAGVALIVLFPTFLHWWALTLVRDLATHLAAFVGLLLLLPAHGRRLAPRRVATAGLALGFAVSTRPDAVLYLVPALLMATLRWRRERAGAREVVRGYNAGVLGLAIGLAPFLAYNWAATGSPFRPTQGMEIRDFLPAQARPAPEASPPAPRVGFPSAAPWRGGTVSPVQGGGLRLDNLPKVLPGMIERGFRKPYGDLFLALAIWGALVALVQRRLLFVAAVPYTILAVLFFSCWSKPDERYLSGIYVFLPMLVIEGAVGTLDLVRRLWRTGSPGAARAFSAGFAVLLAAGSLLMAQPDASGALPVLLRLVPSVAAAAALAAALWPARRIVRFAAPVLALALVTVACVRGRGSEQRARFQRPEMLRARATFARAVEPRSVVITTEDVGRPGENIDYYSGVAHALYLTDLARWGLSVGDAAELLARGGFHPYLLIPTIQRGRAAMLGALGTRFAVDLAADIPATQAMDYFVAAAFYPRGIHMELYRLRWLGGPAASP
jgi:4-amino-4-deoxy-L-arabinose transferase-like glycosyltransferase